MMLLYDKDQSKLNEWRHKRCVQLIEPMDNRILLVLKNNTKITYPIIHEIFDNGFNQYLRWGTLIVIV